MKKKKSKLAKLDRRNVNDRFPIFSSLLTKEYDVSFTDENGTAQSKCIQDLTKSNRLEEKVKTDRLLENSAFPELFRFRKKEEHYENYLSEDQNENDIDSKEEEPAMTNPDIPIIHGMESDYPKKLLTEDTGELFLYFLI